MVKRYSIEEARDNFSRVVREAESGIQVELTRQGKPVAVLVGVEDFERLSKGRPAFWEVYQNFRSEFGADIEFDADENFGDATDPSRSQNVPS